MTVENLIVELSEIAHNLGRGESEEEYLEKALAIDFDNIINFIDYGKVDTDNAIILTELVIIIIKAIFELTGQDMVTDEKYDDLHQWYKDMTGKSVVGVEGGGDHVHKYPRLRGSADKIHFMSPNDSKRKDDNRRSYIDFLESVSRKLNRPLPHDTELLLSLKVDGVSGVAECNKKGISEKCLKRGDTTNDKAKEIFALKNIDFSEYVEEFLNTPFGIKLEIAMTESNFEEYKKRYGAKTPRSAVTSIVNSEDVDHDKVHYLSIIPLQYQVEGEELERVCYLDKYTRTVNAYDFTGIREAIGELFGVHLTEGLPADGVVFRIMNEDIVKELGRDDDINNYEVAFKFPSDSADTVIRDVKFSLGILGGITPVAVIDKVTIKGATIDSPSLGSIGRLKRLGLKYNQNVTITHDVIPYLEPIEDGSGDDVIPIITECPICGTTLTELNEELSCKNEMCPGLIRGKIVNYIEKTDMGSLSNSTVDDFFINGYLTKISDLYRLHEHTQALYNLKGYGKKSIDGILDAIDSRRELKDHVFFGALGIKGIGRKMFKKIFNELTLDEFIYHYQNDSLTPVLSKIKGIGYKNIESITNFMNNNIDELKDLLDQVKIVSGRNSNVPGSLNILFTKVRDKELEGKLEELGHTISSGYNKSVDIVVVPSYDTKSSKVDKAVEDGKLILTVKDLKKELKI